MIKLPIDEHLPAIANLMKNHQNLVIKASPGSGKTTRIPAFLNKTFKKIIVLEPRRIAAISASQRIAEENNWPLGEKVGYHVRFDKKYKDNTEIVFLTEALLARQLLSEDSLKGIDLIILDEFHERSQWTDLCLGIIKEWQDLGSPIKLMLLSATIDDIKIQQYLSNCAIYNVELPTYPLEKIYSKQPFKVIFDKTTTDKIIEALKDAWAKKRKNILIFLPGVGEINRLQKELETCSFTKDYEIELLHGNLPLEIQRKVITNASETKKIILSTNLAESSVTINNLDTVIDTGLIKISDYQIKTAVQQLNLRKISMASAEQRQGRANRQQPGLVYKLWTLHDELSMEKYTPAEITRSDLSHSLMFLTYLGASSDSYFTSFSWFEAPPELNLKLTTQDLIEKNILKDRKLSSLGLLLLNLNIEFHQGMMILLGDYLNCLSPTCELIALLQEKDILSENFKNLSSSVNDNSLFSDLILRFEVFSQNKQRYPQVGKLAQSLQQSYNHLNDKKLSNIEELIQNLDPDVQSYLQKIKQLSLLEKLRFLIDFTFADRICRRRKKSGQKDFIYINEAVNRFGTQIQIFDSQFKENFYPQREFFLSLRNFLTPNKSLVANWVHFIEFETLYLLLKPHLASDFEFNFNQETGKFSKAKVTRYHSMILKVIEGFEITSEDKNQMFASTLKNNFDNYKTRITDMNLFYQRLNFLKSKGLISEDFEFNPDELIEQVSYGESSIEDILKKDWHASLDAVLEPELKTLLQREAPLNWKSKSSNKSFKVMYENSEAFIESKLQNFFGLKEHPSIGTPSYPLKLVMLGPNGRPIQITRDLLSFWKSSYPDIRKELRGRYPKHAWPEDPENY